MDTELSLNEYSFNVTEKSHKVVDRYSQTHPGIGRSKNPETAPFKPMKEIFLMAVYLGARSGRPRPLDGKKMDIFKGLILSHDEKMYLCALAVGYREDPDVLAEPQQVIRIAEEFANAGIWKLEEILDTTDEAALWDLADHFAKELESG